MATVADRTRTLKAAKNGNGFVIRYHGLTLWAEETNFKDGSKVYATLVKSGKTPTVVVKQVKGKKYEESENWVVLMRKNLKTTLKKNEGFKTPAQRLAQLKG